jgi:nucleotide-binding universal stress UspA family protein
MVSIAPRCWRSDAAAEFALQDGVVDGWKNSGAGRTAALAAKYLGEVEDSAAASVVTCGSVHVEHKQPYQAIIDTANKRGCDLIVMASHGRRGASAIVLGSETVKVVTHTAIPVLVCRSLAATDSLFGRLSTLTVL